MSPQQSKCFTYGLLELVGGRPQPGIVRIEDEQDLQDDSNNYRQFIVMPRYGYNLASYFKQ